jgi:predicted nucleic acid-binding protein
VVDADAQWAFMNFQGKDFEDALQVACALREDCSSFATLDELLAKKYKKDMTVWLL